MIELRFSCSNPVAWSRFCVGVLLCYTHTGCGPAFWCAGRRDSKKGASRDSARGMQHAAQSDVLFHTNFSMGLVIVHISNLALHASSSSVARMLLARFAHTCTQSITKSTSEKFIACCISSVIYVMYKV